MIHSVRLKHFKSHDVTEIAFGKGTNMLVGPMGGGKSSVVEAVCFALYGTTPSLKARRCRLSDLVMQRPLRYDEASVEVVFEEGGRRYSVERIISQEGSDAFLRLDGKLVEKGGERVTEAVERILKTDYELFTRAIYSEQNRIDYFLSLGRGDRKRQIDELLGIDRLETARSTASTVVNKLKSLKREDEDFLLGMDLPGLDAEEAGLKQETAALETESARLERAVAELESKKAGFDSDLAGLERREADFNSLSQELAGVVSVIESAKADASALEGAAHGRKKSDVALEKAGLEAELSQLKLLAKEIADANAAAEKEKGGLEQVRRQKSLLKPPAGDAEGAFSSAEKKVASAREEEKAISQELSLSKASIASLEAELKKASLAASRLALLDSEMEKLAPQAGGLAAAQNEFASLSQQAASLKAGLGSLEDSLNALDSADADCPVCGAELGAEKKAGLKEEKQSHLTRSRAELAAVEAKFREAESSLSECSGAKARLDSIEGERKALADAAASVKQAGESLGGLRKGLAFLDSKVQSASKSVKSFEAAAQEARAAAEQAREWAELSQQEASLAKAVAEKEAVVARKKSGYSEARVSQVEAELKSLDGIQQYFALLEKVESLKPRRADVQKRIDGLSFDPAGLKSLREEMSSAVGELAKASARMEVVSASSAEKKNRLADLGEKKLVALEKKENADFLSGRANGMTKFQTSLTESQAVLREELVDSVNQALASLWRGVYPYDDYSSLRLRAADDDYYLELQALGGDWVGVETASGGERACASLALRVAFAVVLAPNLSWLVLDEPTHNLDAEAVSLFSSALRSDIPKLVEQVFIITHDESLKEGASAKVYRVDRDKDRGDKSSVEEVSMA